MAYIDEYIEEDLTNIFEGINPSTLSDYKKREIIFDYLVENLQYDWSIYLKLLNDAIRKRISNPYDRNFKKEFDDVIIHHKGVCIAIASYYDTLLKRMGINGSVIGTNDETPVHHVLNIVYNKESDTYSFDDVTSMITRNREKELCFDYDIEDAITIKQGIRPLFHNRPDTWMCYPSIDYSSKIPRTKFKDFEGKIISIRKLDNPQRKRKNTI